eukprot:6855312-Prorocentrum_lima.AAC.1
MAMVVEVCVQEQGIQEQTGKSRSTSLQIHHPRKNNSVGSRTSGNLSGLMSLSNPQTGSPGRGELMEGVYVEVHKVQYQPMIPALKKDGFVVTAQ